MLKKILPLIATIVFNFTSWSQSPGMAWQHCIGGSSWDIINCMQPTADGGYIMAGYSNSSDGDVSGYHGNVDAWVVKVDSAGSIVWQKCLGGTEEDKANSILPTTDGGYIMAGNSYSNNGDVSGNHGICDVWVVKLSSTGVLQWQKTFGGSGNDFGFSVAIATDGSYVVAGSTQSNDGTAVGNTATGDVPWVLKLSTTGALVWQHCILNPSSGFGAPLGQIINIQVTTGGYIVTGNVTCNTTDGRNLLVAKITNTGSLTWQKCLGGTYYDSGQDIQLTPDGGYIVAGYTQSDNGDVIGYHQGYDAWILKLDSAGIIQWQRCLGGSNDDYANTIQLLGDGSYSIAGYSDSVDSDVSGNHGYSDAWLVRISSTGTILWQKSMGGTSYDQGIAILPTTDGGYVLGLNTYSNDGDVSGNHGGYDTWLVKLRPDTLTTGAFANQTLALFPNPATSLLTLQQPNNNLFDKVTITDMTGKTLLTQTTNTTQIPIATLASGVYIIEASSGKQKFVSKFVKE